MNLKEMLEKRKALLEKANALHKKATAENRDLTTDEQSEYDGYMTEIDTLDPKIDQAVKAQEAQERQNRLEQYASGSTGRPATDPNAGLSRGELSDLRAFSFTKFMRESSTGQLTGLEQEMAQQAQVDAKNAGATIEGFGIPQMVLQSSGRHYNTDLSVTQDGGAHGAETVPTELRSIIDILRENLVVQSMGAQMLGGLVGDIDFPRANTDSDPTEKSEIGESDKNSPDFDSVSLRPKRLPVHAIVTRQLLHQSSIDVEAWMRNYLAFRMASRMDKQAINGDGTGSNPTGILNTAGLPVVAIATDGGAPTRDHVIQLEGEVDQSNALFGNLGYVTNPKVRTKLKLTKTDTGSGIFVWNQREELNGYRAGVSTNVPSDLTKGTGTDLSALIFGNWTGCMIGQWGGLDVLVNPYSLDTSGRIRINLWTYYDVAIERANMFAAIVDADTTI